MVRFTTLLCALSTIGSFVAASPFPSQHEVLRRQDCSGAVGTYTQQCVLYGINCECSQDGTTACSANGSGNCPVTSGGGGGGGGSIPTDPGAGACPSCGTGNAGGSNNVGPGTSSGDGSDD